jgi:hypothetical protein
MMMRHDTARSTVISTATGTSARRADAGSVRLGERDVAGLLLVGEIYGAAHLIEQLLAALNVECLFRKDDNQASIWVTITDTTPATITALLADPRADHNQPDPAPPASSPATPYCGVGTKPYWRLIYHDHWNEPGAKIKPVC